MFKRLESTRFHAFVILVIFIVLAALVLFQTPGEWPGSQLSRAWIIGILAVSLALLLLSGHRYHALYLDELNQREDRFRSTFEQAAVGVAHVSTAGKFLEINERFCEIVGYSKSEMLELTFQDITHRDDLDTDLAHVQELLEGKSRSYSMEKRYLRKDGEYVWVNLTVSLLRDDTGQPRWFVSVVEDITEHKLAAASVEMYQRRLQGLLAEQGHAAEKDRERISWTLHDGAAQNLASALIKLDLIGSHLPGPENQAGLKEVSRLLRQCILEINSMSADLNPPALSELGLAAAIREWMANNVQGRHAITAELVDLRDDDKREHTDSTVRLLLFRNACELLTNAVSHAQATQIRVSLREVGDNLVLEVCDNGIGCFPEEALRNSREGVGLFAIQECMAELGGGLKIESVPGHGFSATMILPVQVPVKDQLIHRTG